MNKIIFCVLSFLACTQIESKFVCKGMVRLQPNLDSKPSKLILTWTGDVYNFPIYIYMQKPYQETLKPEAFIADGKWLGSDIHFTIPQNQLLRSKPLYIYFYMYTPDDAGPVGTLRLSTKSQSHFEFTPLN